MHERLKSREYQGYPPERGRRSAAYSSRRSRSTSSKSASTTEASRRRSSSQSNKSQRQRARTTPTYVRKKRLARRFSTHALVISILLEVVFIGALCLRSTDHPLIIEKAAFGIVLLWLSNTDLLWRNIPNTAILAALAIRIIYIAYYVTTDFEHLGIIWNSLLGCAVIGVFAFAISYMTERLSGRAGLGGGDVKLLAVAGLYFGLEGGVLILFLACIAALAGYAFKRSDDGTFPFAPAISIACAVVALI